jgi:acyl-coenzyme A thioesterase PaaI-like protein
MSLDLEDNKYCYGCGDQNPSGLRMSFEHPEKGRLLSKVTFAKEHQGFKGIVHGGMVSLVLDEVMLNLCWLEGLRAVTAELTVRLKKPVPVGESVLFEGIIDSQEGRAVYTSGTAKNSRGELLATAKATCIRAKEQ